MERLPLNDELKQRAALVLSELATNAVLHAGTPFFVRVHHDGRSVRVEVEDASPALPDLAGESAMSGRGLRIVDAPATNWGSQRKAGGKVVWAELKPRPPA